MTRLSVFEQNWKIFSLLSQFIDTAVLPELCSWSYCSRHFNWTETLKYVYWKQILRLCKMCTSDEMFKDCRFWRNPSKTCTEEAADFWWEMLCIFCATTLMCRGLFFIACLDGISAWTMWLFTDCPWQEHDGQITNLFMVVAVQMMEVCSALMYSCWNKWQTSMNLGVHRIIE